MTAIVESSFLKNIFLQQDSNKSSKLFSQFKPELGSVPSKKQFSHLTTYCESTFQRAWKLLTTSFLSSIVWQVLQSTHSKPPSPSEVFKEHLTAPKVNLDSLSRERPELPLPSIMSILFMAHKMVSAMNHQKMLFCKTALQIDEDKKDRIRKEKMAQWEKQSRITKAITPWSTSATVFVWISSCLEILSGIAMIAMGNPIGGGLLLAGGVISFTNVVMMHTGLWDKILEILPGDDIEQKRKVISWMQIGITILGLMLGAAGAALTGTSVLSPAMQHANTLSMAALMIGQAIVTIGLGVKQSQLKDTEASSQKLSTDLQALEYHAQDLREDVDKGIQLEKRCNDMVIQVMKQEQELCSFLFRSQ